MADHISYVNSKYAELVEHVRGVGAQLQGTAPPCCPNCRGLGAVVMSGPPNTVTTLLCSCTSR